MYPQARTGFTASYSNVILAFISSYALTASSTVAKLGVSRFSTWMRGFSLVDEVAHLSVVLAA